MRHGVALGMAFIGPWEIALIILVVLILFGPKKLPELARSVGDAMKQYRKAAEGPLTEEPKPSVALKEEGKVLVETAKKLGIETEGKTPEEISKEIVAKTAKPSRRRRKKAVKKEKE